MEKIIPKLENKEVRKILEGHAEVLFFGKDKTLDELGWSMRHLQRSGDELKPENQHLVKLLREVAKEKNIHTFLAPIAVPQNGKLELAPLFERTIDLCDGVVVKRGSDVEGVLIEKGEAFLVSPADCLTVVAESEKGILATHAGRESLFNVNYPNREGVVENLIKILGTGAKIWAGFGISKDFFIHNKSDITHGEINWLREYLISKKLNPFLIKADEKMDLYEVLLSLVDKNNAHRENVTIDKSICTYSEVGGDGERRFFSRRFESGSNLAIVYKL